MAKNNRHIISKRLQYRCGWSIDSDDGKEIITIALYGKPTKVKLVDYDEDDYYVEELECKKS